MNKYLWVVGLLLPFVLQAQTITGSVTNQKNQPLQAASVHWLGSSNGVLTNESGAFSINATNVIDKRLVATFVGYANDTVDVTNQLTVAFVLKELHSINEVTVKSQREGIILSNRSPMKIEQITQAELKKAACCDLAGCFETQLTVQPQTTNVITNSKELRILGLSGVYNQVLIDGLPMIQGLSYTYGISSIPGTLVDNIYVSKGANSVLQGYESISGQINVETKKPDNTDKLLLNVYMNNFMEKHINANYAVKKGKWSNLTAVQVVQPAKRVDNDKDDFLDLPLLTRYMLHNRTKYGKETNWGWSTSIAVRYFNEQRIGGQKNYRTANDKGSTLVYGQTVNINQPELMTKTNYRFNDKHNLVLQLSAFHQNQASYFGTVKYNAKQSNVYTNLQHELNYNKNQLKWGISFRHMKLDENIAFTETFLGRNYAGKYQRHENIPGIFSENTMSFLKDKLTWIAGVRLDHHNQFNTMFTPRTLLKYEVSAKTILRANIGTGWRTVNLFSENINLLASSRDIVFTESLQPEKALNLGFSFVQKFNSSDNNLTGSFTMDYYHTSFQNQIFPDYDTDPTKAFIKNFKGKSISNGFQAELYLKLWKRFEYKAGYNYLHVYQVNNGEKNVLPFNPMHKVLSTLSFKPLSNRFHVDVNVHWFGKQRLPNTSANTPAYQRPNDSQAYTTASAQVTYNWQKVEVYAGCENIFGFRQNQPIISWQNPFSPYFDTSSVWGPTRGRETYVGVRFKLSK